jgi:hypothetical protein
VASPVPVVQPVPSHSASPPPSSLVPQSPCLDSPAQRLTPTLTAPLPPPPREPASEVGTHPQRFGPVRPPARDLPRPFGNLRLIPGFSGFVTFFYGPVRPFPLAPLPRLAVILPSTVLGPRDPVPSTPLRSYPLLALPWYDVDNTRWSNTSSRASVAAWSDARPAGTPGIGQVWVLLVPLKPPRALRQLLIARRSLAAVALLLGARLSVLAPGLLLGSPAPLST